MNLKLSIILLFSVSSLLAQQVQREIKISKKYLNLPIQSSQKRQKMVFATPSKPNREFVIRLSDGKPDYWVFADVTEFIGKNLVLTYPDKAKGLELVYQSDMIDGSDSLYHEINRPQFHFTTKRGWINDPNGLVYYDGEYHLFYQHNPFERDWENMHWGHAVSRDLLHWEELPDALYPDKSGSMFSGTAIVDLKNSSGFQKGNEKTIVAAYTTHCPDKEVQCIAYSNDKGRTFQKFEGNPVIDSKEKWNSTNTRDPKIFWHNDSKKWVMVLFENEGMSIYTSDDLKKWMYQSHIKGFWECPELFQLPVDGNESNKKWVLYGASGTYLIGDFDGNTFTPVSDKLCYYRGNMYASQTFSNIPGKDGRRIQIGWGTIDQQSKAFNNMMTFPTSLSLRSTRDGIRMFSEPIAELSKLFTKSYSWENLSVGETNEKLKDLQGDYLHVKMTVELATGVEYKLLYHGNTLLEYDMNKNTLNKEYYGGDHIENLIFYFEILIDRTSVEIFADHGKFSLIAPLPKPVSTSGLAFEKNWSEIKIKHIEVNEMQSIWK